MLIWADEANVKKTGGLIGITTINFIPLAGTRATVIGSGFGLMLRDMQVGARFIITIVLANDNGARRRTGFLIVSW